MEKFFEKQFSRKPDKAEEGGSFFQIPWYEAEYGPAVLARREGVTEETILCWAEEESVAAGEPDGNRLL